MIIAASTVPNAWLPDSASSMAPAIDALFYALLSASTIAVVAFVLTVSGRIPRRVVEAASTGWRVWVGLALASVGLGAGFLVGLVDWVALRQAPGDALVVHVRIDDGRFAYSIPAFDVDAPELVVPVDTPIQLISHGDEDGHLWSAPALRLHAAVSPQARTTTWFEATKPGRFDVFGSRADGTPIASTAVGVVVPDVFGEWVDERAGGGDLPPVERGRKVFVDLGCAVCHSETLESGGKACPPLGGRYGGPTTLVGGEVIAFDGDYVRESLLDPSAKIVAGFQPVMPSFAGRIRPRQLDAIVAYLESIGDTGR